MGMNRRNTYFLFEDRIKRELQVYTLERKNEYSESFENTQIEATYHFVTYYVVKDFFQSNMFLSINPPYTFINIDVNDDD